MNLKHAEPIAPERVIDAARDVTPAVTTKRPTSGKTGVRECGPEDLPIVAALFQRLLRNGEKCNLPGLASYLKDLFFEHPWRDPDLKSLVSVAADGTVNGFIGVLPARMTYRGKHVRAALATSLMVDRSKQNPLAGVCLLRSFLTGPQDLSLTDTANRVSQRMWQCHGGSVATEYSMDWVRILRPAEAGIAMAEGRSRIAGTLHGVARMVDTFLGTDKRHPFNFERNDGRIKQADLGTTELVNLIARFAANYDPKPAWSTGDLRWFLTHAACKEKYGALTARSVLAANGVPIGGYLYYGRPGRCAFVLQIITSRQHADIVVKSLLADVYDLGCAAVRGQTEPNLLDALLQNGCIFKSGSSVMVHSANQELLSAIKSGTAWMTGLGGESWSRLIRGQFL